MPVPCNLPPHCPAPHCASAAQRLLVGSHQFVERLSRVWAEGLRPHEALRAARPPRSIHLCYVEDSLHTGVYYVPIATLALTADMSSARSLAVLSDSLVRVIRVNSSGVLRASMQAPARRTRVCTSLEIVAVGRWCRRPRAERVEGVSRRSQSSCKLWWLSINIYQLNLAPRAPSKQRYRSLSAVLR